MKRTLLLGLIMAVMLGCEGDKSPTDPTESIARGRLSGIVTIGPNCPGPTTTNPCPTPPSAYSLRKVLVLNDAGTTLLHSVDIDSRGAYLIDLVPATYTIDLQKSGSDRVSNLPTKITIVKNTVTMVNIDIDTGIR